MKKILFLVLFSSQFAHAQTSKANFADSIRAFVFELSKIMMHDVVDPAAASRYYAYAMLGPYDIITLNDRPSIAPSVLIKNYPAFKPTLQKETYDPQIASLYCILEIGVQLLPSGYQLAGNEEIFLTSLKKYKIKKKIISNSVELAKQAAAHVIEFSKTDNYNRLSAKLRYTPLKGDQYWYPTPPGYIEAVEPQWKIIRPILIDSASQFKPVEPIAFSKDSNSAFYKQAMEVYQTVLNLTPEQTDIANFWDCNPFAISSAGHMMIGFKKITPGGHWMNIAGIATQKAKLDFSSAIIVQAISSFAMMDAFISCWDEKYRSNRIRPETYINKYIDIKWQPILQTPPFPEYTSGHSVVSTIASEVLTYLMGDHFSYTDNSELLFQIPERKFSSFIQAAQEASISRLYGGIHYRDAIVNGQTEGKALAAFVIDKIKQAGVMPFVK